MSNKIFNDLRKKMTFQYSLISCAVIFTIVIATYALNWWSILTIEKKDLHEKAIHEGEEWITSGELPVNENELESEEVLAYFVTSDWNNIIINQMGNGVAGKAIMAKISSWPDADNYTCMIRAHDISGKTHFRYLATVCMVKNNGDTIGYLYMFKNMETYYAAGWQTIKILIILFIILFSMASLGSFWLAGHTIQPISDAYEKQKQFTADASHEMRTPIAVMKLAVQGIKTDDKNQLSSFSINTVSILEQEVERLGHLTETLMNLARNDKEMPEQEFGVVPLSELCIEVVNQLKIVAFEKNIIIQSDIAPGIFLYGHEYSLNRLLIILLDNAIKYSPEYSEITIALSSTQDMISLKVYDQGMGIENEEKGKIFERFYRVDKARSRSMGGLGLGLSLAKTIIEKHKGEILVEDNTPKGSIFTIKLPKTKS